MKRQAFLLIILLLALHPLCAQRVEKVSGTYTYHAPENVTQEEAKRIALERAKLQAIADKFGTIVSQSNSTMVKNENGESSTRFFSLGGSEVKGEWIETIGQPQYEISYDGGILVVQASVHGRAREVVSSGIDLDVKVLCNGTEERFAAEEFKDGDALYLSFKSPVDGYLAVYLLDEAMQTFCLLPYPHQGTGAYRIQHDKTYVFFSKEHDEVHESEVEHYLLTAEKSCETNTLIIVFSPNEFVKPNAKSSSDLLPYQLPYKDFQKWLGKLCRKDNKATQKKILIRIRE